MPPDYSIYYGIFHDDSEAHARSMADHMWAVIKCALPEDRRSRILDVGCGFGFALRALRDAGYENALGLETSPQQASRATAAGLKVEVVSDSIAWLRSHPHAFDLVLLLDVLEHVPVAHQIELLVAIRSALRPGGRIFLQVPNANAMLANRWRYGDFTHHSSFTEHSLYFALANAGFSKIHMAAEKGIGRMPKRLWRRATRAAWRKWFIRWLWLQVFKAELPWENLENISFELNLKAIAYA
jgi:2-polyprenyl-3-methyl-5-hydroxy-6-metoxy-1,4-benzoquinol methylase